MNGGMDIIINRIPNAISIPAKALFTRAGKPIVYVAENGRYRPVGVEVLARNPDEIAVSGIRRRRHGHPGRSRKEGSETMKLRLFLRRYASSP